MELQINYNSIKKYKVNGAPKNKKSLGDGHSVLLGDHYVYAVLYLHPWSLSLKRYVLK